MQQSMRHRFRSPTPRTLARAVTGAAALALAVSATAASAENAETVPADGTRALAGALADAPVNGSADADRYRPRWIEPRRGDGAVPRESVAERDWRSDARVIVHAAARETRLGVLVAGMLERLGSDEVERRVVEVSAATDQVRFFHAEDAPMANALAAELESLFGEVRVRDLTFYRPQPESGALEVWLR